MAPIFTGVARGIGGWAFGAASGGEAPDPANDPGIPGLSGGNTSGTEPGDGYRYCLYTGSGTLSVPAAGQIDVMVIGGAGAGGGAQDGFGGGGGAGGVALIQHLPVTPGTYAISIGGGGSSASPTQPGEGTNSAFAPGTDWEIYGYGGGGGGTGPRGTKLGGNPGGSGGGSRKEEPSPNGTATQPNATPNFGSKVTPLESYSNYIKNFGSSGGGNGEHIYGGGASEAQGSDSPNGTVRGDGIRMDTTYLATAMGYDVTVGSPYNPRSPNNDHYGAGGCGGSNSTRSGYGNSPNQGRGGSHSNGTSGGNYTCGGGGGGRNGSGNWNNGGSGGDGYVVVRTPI